MSNPICFLCNKLINIEDKDRKIFDCFCDTLAKPKYYINVSKYFSGFEDYPGSDFFDFSMYINKERYIVGYLIKPKIISVSIGENDLFELKNFDFNYHEIIEKLQEVLLFK